jgi:hypothetical protein
MNSWLWHHTILKNVTDIVGICEEKLNWTLWNKWKNIWKCWTMNNVQWCLVRKWTCWKSSVSKNTVVYVMWHIGHFDVKTEKHIQYMKKSSTRWHSFVCTTWICDNSVVLMVVRSCDQIHYPAVSMSWDVKGFILSSFISTWQHRTILYQDSLRGQLWDINVQGSCSWRTEKICLAAKDHN